MEMNKTSITTMDEIFAFMIGNLVCNVCRISGLHFYAECPGRIHAVNLYNLQWQCVDNVLKSQYNKHRNYVNILQSKSRNIFCGQNNILNHQICKRWNDGWIGATVVTVDLFCNCHFVQRIRTAPPSSAMVVRLLCP